MDGIWEGNARQQRVRESREGSEPWHVSPCISRGRAWYQAAKADSGWNLVVQVYVVSHRTIKSPAVFLFLVSLSFS